LAASGLDPRAFAAVRDLFSPSGFLVTPGGRAPASPAPAARAGLEPGDAVAVDVLRGDLNFSAIGTVTWRDGDRVLLFGHPFFQSGEVRLPLSRAEITTVVSSLASSFKLGVPGEPVGVATQDRRAAVAGRLGGVPRLLPFAVDVALPGAATRAFHFQTIEDRALAPQLVSAAALNSLLESGGSGPEQTVRWTLDLWRQGRRLTLADVEAGEAPFSDVLSGVGAPLRFLFGNPYERLRLDSLRVRLEATPGREQWTLRQAAFDRAAVRPGGTLAVAVEIERWRGPRRTLALRLPVPEELPDGHYVLHLAGGPEYDRFLAQRLPARFRPVSLDDAWRRLASFHASDAVYAALWARAPEITQAGEDYPELPTSALPLLSPPGQSGDRARRGDWALVSEARVPVAGVLRGELVLDVDVDSKAP
ncbi:MAG TPA: hypothetical protein VGU27_07425, partial [Candidatus Eisenbacteria bacterium]|nr:hypothetical protein [Candidatus Eisenbacteria bacterium]